MEKKKLSFIIPAYNCADFMEETIGSVITQLPDDCELVIVDDGSTDETAQRLKELESGQENIRVMYAAHGGASTARNHGLDMAEGEWVTFMDCDDCLVEGFFEKAMPLLEDETDLYIFSFERVEFTKDEEAGVIKEIVMPLEVKDCTYPIVSVFADKYIRARNLLVYSACNKFYRRSLLDGHGIRFRDGMPFGEDRLFNYDYLMHCGQVRTSSLRMFRYIQRNPDSASKRSYPDYFNTIMTLHKAKMDCFLSLSKGTTLSEKRAFTGYDLSTEVSRMIDRFPVHPNERDENLPYINSLLFGEPDDTGGRYDVIIVLGSRNCAYRAEKALEAAGGDPDTVFLVTGGNEHKEGSLSEAVFMAEYLRERGIPDSRILLEEAAENTFRNLKLSAKMIDAAVRTGILPREAKDLRIGIVTAGFHVPRTRAMTRTIPWYDDKNIVFIPAYGAHTKPDNWYLDSTGKSICLGEIAKCCCVGTESAGE